MFSLKTGYFFSEDGRRIEFKNQDIVTQIFKFKEASSATSATYNVMIAGVSSLEAVFIVSENELFLVVDNTPIRQGSLDSILDATFLIKVAGKDAEMGSVGPGLDWIWFQFLDGGTLIYVQENQVGSGSIIWDDYTLMEVRTESEAIYSNDDGISEPVTITISTDNKLSRTIAGVTTEIGRLINK